MLSYAAGIPRLSRFGDASPIFPVSPDERQTGELALAIARVCLAASMLVASVVEPAVASSPLRFLPFVLGAYTAFAAAVLFVASTRQTRWKGLAVVVHVIDVSTAVALMLASDGGSLSWMLAVFVLLAGTYRWDFRVTMMTAAPMIALLSIQGTVNFTNASSLAVASIRQLGTSHIISQFALPLLTGFVLAYIVQAEKRLRTEAATIA